MVGTEPYCDDALALLSPEVAHKVVENVRGLVCQDLVNSARRSDRFLIAEPVTVQPLNDRFEPAAFECSALTRDISSTGVGLICLKQFDLPFLRVTFNNCDKATGNSLILKIVHETPRGAVFLLGGSIAIDWDLADETKQNLSDSNHPLFKLAILRDIRRIMKD